MREVVYEYCVVSIPYTNITNRFVVMVGYPTVLGGSSTVKDGVNIIASTTNTSLTVATTFTTTGTNTTTYVNTLDAGVGLQNNTGTESVSESMTANMPVSATQIPFRFLVPPGAVFDNGGVGGLRKAQAILCRSLEDALAIL